jgi:cytochrome c-type biogenesis protein CcmH/NrfG
MKRESLAYAVSGTFFGLLLGWILGSQQAAPAMTPASTQTTAAAPATTATTPAPAGASPTAQPLDVQRAAGLEKTANAQPSNSSVRFELANLYFDAERFDLAIPWYESGLKIDSQDVDASTDLGVCYYYTNQIDRALAQLDHSLSINPRHAKTLFNQGIVRAFGKQDLKGAAESWQKVIDVAPDSEEAKRARQGLDGLKTGHGAGGGGGTVPPGPQD